jgi:ligand-binding sensor domain-containing protein
MAAAAWVLAGGVCRGADSLVTDAYALKLWTVEDRLPGSPVVGVSQSADGYLWLVTRTQLIRFNGVDFEEVPVPATCRRDGRVGRRVSGRAAACGLRAAGGGALS